ncbi:MAG: chemotaxis protein CheW [Desulfatiglans sp.]|mgnify:CR=1 FL=1|jgi:purine-binding chemotaxis protein CheW|nr:chemotaxis protein CheW [Desulfatiglans sp.]
MAATEILETNKYLSFKLDNEIYAFDISQVREVLDYTEITKVPKMPVFVKGIINLRGGVVPVVDLRKKFDLPTSENTVNTCIIIMDISIDNEKTLIGALADSVQEVMTIEPDFIEPPPKIGTRLDTEFIRGMGKKNDKFIIIIDIDKVFSVGETYMLQETGEYRGFEDASQEDMDKNIDKKEIN